MPSMAPPYTNFLGGPVFWGQVSASYRVSAAKRIFDSPGLLQETLEYIAYKSREASILEKQKAKTLLDNTQW